MNPPDFFLGGGFGFIGVKPANVGRWSFAIGGFHTQVGESLISSFDSSNAGWSSTNNAGFLTAFWYFGADRRGFYVGPWLGLLSTRYKWGATGETADALYLMIGPVGGFQWFPFGRYLYIQPQIGGAIVPRISGTTSVSSATYHQGLFSPLAELYLGVEW